MAAASGVGMTVATNALPIDPAVRQWLAARGRDPVIEAVSGGDDYELLFTVRPSSRGRLRTVKREIGDVPITRIGVVTKGRDTVLRGPSGDRPLPGGFEHFR